MSEEAAADWVAPLVASRGADRAFESGARPAWWWTGKPPHECAGWEPATAGRAAHLSSLPQLNTASCTRADVRAYFDNTWTLTEQLFASLRSEAAFYLPHYHQLRHPLIFYYGHVAALYVNKLRLAEVLDPHPNPNPNPNQVLDEP